MYSLCLSSICLTGLCEKEGASGVGLVTRYFCVTGQVGGPKYSRMIISNT